MNPRVAILGPFETHALRPYLHPGQQLSEMPAGMGGSCLVNLALARIDRALPTDVITLDPNARQDIARYDGDQVRLWIVRRRAGRALRDGYRQEVRGLVSALEDSRPDICHANWTYEYGLAALKQTVAPSLNTVHDHAGNLLRHLGWRYAPHYVMSRYVMKKASMCTAVSPYIADYVQQWRRDKIPVIPNTFSQLVEKTGRVASPSPAIISLLTWSKFRNTTTALHAFARFRTRYPEATFALLGPGFEPGGPAEQWAAQHQLTGGVQFIGRRPYAEALGFIARSSILLHPSLEESFGSTVAEAMALGVPVIAAREAGGPAWLCESGHGRLIPGRSVSAMADALAEAWMSLKDSPGEEKIRTDGARAHIMERCGSDRVLAQWNDLYSTLLNSTR